ncbi:MAG: hypothetical protein ACKPKO_33155, partial [Candidatus Fonsibacter sp.]
QHSVAGQCSYEARHLRTNMVTLEDVDDQDAGPAPDNDELQPVFYHQLPTDLYLQLIHSFNGVGVLELTVGGDSWHKLVWPRESLTIVSV